LACLSPAVKPITIPELTSRLQAAIEVVPAPVVSSPLLHMLQEQAAAAEQRARVTRSSLRIVVYGSTAVIRTGLTQLIRARMDARISEATTPENLRQLLTTMHVTAIIADMSDYGPVSALVPVPSTPLLVVAPSLSQAQPAVDDGITSVVLAADLPLTAARLAEGLSRIAEGQQTLPTEVLVHRSVPPTMPPGPLPGLSPRETELVVLDLCGWSTHRIAERFGVESLTITSYWKRIYRKLNRNRKEVRCWAAAQLRLFGIRDTDLLVVRAVGIDS
jgi:DNA-binding NarL/FixJ family response regulator